MRRRYRTSSFDMWEKPLHFLAVSGIVVLVLSQALLLKESPRRFLSWVDKIEGDPISMQTPVASGSPMIITENTAVVNRANMHREHRVVTIRMQRPAYDRNVYILVNGSRYADFRDGEVHISVYEGDYIEVDATGLKLPGEFIVHAGGYDIVSPLNGLVVDGKESILPIGKVIFKH